MSSQGGNSGKRTESETDDDENKQRIAKERRIEHTVRKVETHMMASFSKLHSTGVILNQAKANVEMVGGLGSRHKEELKITRLRLVGSLPQDFRLTTVATAATNRFEKALHDQVDEINKVEQALSAAHEILSEQNTARQGPWPPVPPIKARPESKPRTPPRR